MKLKCEATGIVVDAPEHAAENLKKAGFVPVGEKKATKVKKKKAEEPEPEPEETPEGGPEQEGE